MKLHIISLLQFSFYNPIFVMVGKFIFSFAFCRNLVLDQASLARSLIIKFRSGFHLFKVMTNIIALAIDPIKEVFVGSKPTL